VRVTLRYESTFRCFILASASATASPPASSPGARTSVTWPREHQTASESPCGAPATPRVRSLPLAERASKYLQMAFLSIFVLLPTPVPLPPPPPSSTLCCCSLHDTSALSTCTGSARSSSTRSTIACDRSSFHVS